MFAFFKNLFESNKPSTARRPQSIRLGVEALEDRFALSANSAAVHAVLDYTGHSVAFFNDKASGNLFEKTDQGFLQNLGHFSPSNTFSVGQDHNGFAELYSQPAFANNIFFRSDAGGGFQAANPPVPMQTFAAVTGGRMYAVGTDFSVWQFQSPYSVHGFMTFGGHTYPVTISYAARWTEILGANTLRSLDAVTDTANHDTLYGNGLSGNQVFMFMVGTGNNQLIGTNLYSTNFSAGINNNGLGDVFGVTAAGSLVKWSGGVSVTAANVDTSSVISADNNGGCFFTTNPSYGYNTVGLYDALYGVSYLPPWAYSNVTQISAASANDLVAVTANGTLEEYFGTTYNGHWLTYN